MRCVASNVMLVVLTEAVLVWNSQSAQAGMTILSGPPVGTHVGNLVTNGSFEIGAPPPGAANYVIWPTGSLIIGYSHGMPAGWTSSGPPTSYGYWGADTTTGPYPLRSSAPLPDGSAGMYFGNAVGNVDQPPNFAHPDGTVTFPATPNFTPSTGAPVTLKQSVPTNATPAPSYILSFWTSAEGAGAGSVSSTGIFGLKVTNVLPGDPITYLRAPGAGSHRYEFSLTPLNSSNPIDIEFINWGHLDLTPYGGGITTELVMDDVIVNPVPEPEAMCLIALGGVLLRRRANRCLIH